MAIKLNSIGDSADTLGVSKFTVRRLIKKGLIKSVNVGARILISEAELERVASEGVGHRRVETHAKPRTT